jgi:hypothetical protein
MTIIDISKPQGWTEKNMANGWMQRVRTPADSKAAKLKKENETLKNRLDQLEELVSELATNKKGKK